MRQGSHAAAWDRLQDEHQWTQKTKAIPAHLAAYTAYQELLHAYWRGHATSWEVGLARVHWCQEESRLVVAKRSELKPMEGLSGMQWRIRQ
jgi:hypothetical protein